MRPHPIDRIVADLAERQRGVFARWQLLDLGISASMIDNRVRAGRWIIVHAGVYALGHRALRGEAWWLAAALACGREGAASHISGAGVLGLLRDDGTKPHVTVAHGTHRVPGIIVHRSRTLAPQDRIVHDGIPVTSVARTLLDVAATRPRLIARAVDQADMLELFDLRAVENVLGRNRGHRGVRRLVAAIADHHPGSALSDSVIADMFLELVLAAGLPRPEREVYVLPDHRSDFFWRDAGVIVEADGWGSHGTRAAFRRDRTYDRELQFAGYVALRVTRADVLAGAHDVIAGLSRLIAQRGGRIRRQ